MTEDSFDMPEKVHTFIVEEEGQRLDKLVAAELPRYSRSQIQDFIKRELVFVNGETAKPGNRMKGGEEVLVIVPAWHEEFNIEADPTIPLDVIYEDEHIAVIVKQANLVVHPGIGHPTGTMVNALRYRYPQIADLDEDPDVGDRHGLVHRLDKDTSGLIVVALTKEGMLGMLAQFHERTVDKVYLALLERTPDPLKDRIEKPIGRDPIDRKHMGINPEGKEAITDYEVIDTDFRDGRALVRVKIHTGRTHQIRVHMAAMRCPIVGDVMYGYNRQRTKLKRQFLHAAELGFDHPVTGEALFFESELPVSLKNVMEKMRDR